MEERRVAWIALSLTSRIGGKTLSALLQRFNDDPLAILAADSAALQEVRGVGPAIAAAIARIDLARTRRAIERWHRHGVRIVTYADPDYPRRLLQLSDKPPTVFVRGRWPLSARPTIAIIGTRSPSPSGAATAQELATTCAGKGWRVVSGLARGVDSLAHRGALAVEGGLTVAVLGNGLLRPYPPEHGALAQAIQQRGALLCEVAPDAAVSTAGLVARNRIIAALAHVVVFVEGTVRSGAMHAARRALQLGIPLYLHGPALSDKEHLLQRGAKPLPNCWDAWLEQLTPLGLPE